MYIYIYIYMHICVYTYIYIYIRGHAPARVTRGHVPNRCLFSPQS